MITPGYQMAKRAHDMASDVSITTAEVVCHVCHSRGIKRTYLDFLTVLMTDCVCTVCSLMSQEFILTDEYMLPVE